MYQRLQTILWKLLCKDVCGTLETMTLALLLSGFFNVWQYFNVKELHFKQCLNIGVYVIHY